MYLKLYVPILQREASIAHFWRSHRGSRFPSGAQMGPMSRAFVRSIERFAEQEGVVFIGKAQEKMRGVRTEKRRNPQTGQTYPWLVLTTAMVNQYYFYWLDRDFGPFFLKLGSYFPYNGKLLLNCHEREAPARSKGDPLRGARRGSFPRERSR